MNETGLRSMIEGQPLNFSSNPLGYCLFHSLNRFAISLREIIFQATLRVNRSFLAIEPGQWPYLRAESMLRGCANYLFGPILGCLRQFEPFGVGVYAFKAQILHPTQTWQLLF